MRIYGDFFAGSARTAKRALPALALAGTLAACGGGSDGPAPEVAKLPDEANGRVAVTNTQADLDIRVLNPETRVPIDAPDAANKSGPSIARKTNRVTLTLGSEVFPPVVEGEVVQATSVSIKGDHGVVSYNMRGAPRLGAIDWIKGLANDKPRLTASATFNDSDVSALVVDGNNIYAAMATNAPEFPFPSVLERMQIQGDSLTLSGNERVGLTSFVATSVMENGNTIYATSGNTGGVFAFDQTDMSQLGEFPLSDARWVALDNEGRRIVVAQGGQPEGQISVFEEDAFPNGSMNLLNTFPFPGANVPESKTTVEIAGGKAFIAAGPEGVQVVCLDTGDVIGNVPRPDPASLGLSPDVVVTNAVTVDDDLMFISNGEAGVYVATGARDFREDNCDPQDITMLGKLRFDDLQSANHVAYKNRYLLVAAGLGGVKVVRVRTN